MKNMKLKITSLFFVSLYSVTVQCTVQCLVEAVDLLYIKFII